MHLYEDLIAIDRSPKLIEAVILRKDRVLNVQNKRRRIVARRGDGTFGELIPGEPSIVTLDTPFPEAPLPQSKSASRSRCWRDDQAN